MAVSIQTRVGCFRKFVEAHQHVNGDVPGKLQKLKYAMHGFAGRNLTTHPSVVRNFVQQDPDTAGKSLFSRSVELLKDVKTYISNLVQSFLPDCMFSRSLNDILAHRRPVGKDRVKASIPEKLVLSTTNDSEQKHKDYPGRIDTTDSNYDQNVKSYTHPSIEAQPSYADPKNLIEVDFTDNKHQSVVGYDRDSDGAPLNPAGRTGLKGRGILGCWGPNVAADPVILKRAEDGQLLLATIVRKDRPEQKAFPGGFVDGNESFLHAAARELVEEALNLPTDDLFTPEEEEKLKDKFCQVDKNLPSDEYDKAISDTQKEFLVNKILNSDEFKNSKTIYKGLLMILGILTMHG